MPKTIFNMTMKEAKEGFFRPRVINDAVQRGLFEANGQVGGRIRLTARRSMRLATQYRSKSHLKGAALKSHNVRRRRWRAAGAKPRLEPQLPFRPSKPFTPPRYHKKGASLNIRNSIVYAQAARLMKSPAVIVGPTRLSGTSGTPVPALHEHGGTAPPKYRGQKPRKYPPRPFMSAALLVNKDHIEKIYARKINQAFSAGKRRRL